MFPLTQKLVVATHNAGKMDEFSMLLSPFEILPVSARDLELPEPEETGDSFEANAQLKAEAAAKASGLPALADDSGLAVDCLDGAPGIFSARWAGPDRDFALAMRNIEEKLQRLGATSPKQRKARFIAVLCLVIPGGETLFFRGEIEGVLVWPPQGSLGFGYDPMFKPDGHEKSFGEISSEAKHGWTPGSNEGLSHRARAFACFANHCLSLHP